MPDGSLHQLGSDPRSDIGPIAEYLKDITKLPPEIVRPEQYRFRIRIQAQAQTFVSTADRIDAEYVFALRRIKGSVSNPTVNAPDLHRMEFNIVDQGRGRGGIFRNPINMSTLAGTSGPGHDMIWDSFYAFVPGSDINVDFTVLGALTDFIQGGDITFFVSLTGDLVRARRLADGTLQIPGVTGPK